MNERERILQNFFDHFVLKWEGGFSDKSSGDGHVTLMGMTAKQYAARHGKNEQQTEAKFTQLSTLLNHQTGTFKPNITPEQKDELLTFQQQVFNDFKTAYFEKPGFSKIQSDITGAVIADISFNRGPSTTWWVIAKTLADNKAVAFPPHLDPNIVPDPITQSTNNPYLYLPRETQAILMQALNNMVAQTGEAHTISELSKAKLAHHDAHIKAQPSYIKFKNGWANRANDYAHYFSAHHTTTIYTPSTDEIGAILTQSAPMPPSNIFEQAEVNLEEAFNQIPKGTTDSPNPKNTVGDWVSAYWQKGFHRFYVEDVRPHLTKPKEDASATPQTSLTPEERMINAKSEAIKACAHSHYIEPGDPETKQGILHYDACIKQKMGDTTPSR